MQSRAPGVQPQIISAFAAHHAALESLTPLVKKISNQLDANPPNVDKALHGLDLLRQNIVEHPVLDKDEFKQGIRDLIAPVLRKLLNLTAQGKLALVAAERKHDDATNSAAEEENPQQALEIYMALGRFEEVKLSFTRAAALGQKHPDIWQALDKGTQLFLLAYQSPKEEDLTRLFPAAPLVQLQYFEPRLRPILFLDAAAREWSWEARTALKKYRESLAYSVMRAGEYIKASDGQKEDFNEWSIKHVYGIGMPQPRPDLVLDSLEKRELPGYPNLALQVVAYLLAVQQSDARGRQHYLDRAIVGLKKNLASNYLATFFRDFRPTYQFACEQLLNLIFVANDIFHKHELLGVLLHYLNPSFTPKPGPDQDNAAFQNQMLERIVAIPDFFTETKLWQPVVQMFAGFLKTPQLPADPHAIPVLIQRLRWLQGKGHKNPDLVAAVEQCLGDFYSRFPEQRVNAIQAYEAAVLAKPTDLISIMKLLPLLLDAKDNAKALHYCQIALPLAKRRWDAKSIQTIHACLHAARGQNDVKKLLQQCEDFLALHNEVHPITATKECLRAAFLKFQKPVLSQDPDIDAGFRQAWLDAAEKDIKNASLADLDYLFDAEGPAKYIEIKKDLVKRLLVILSQPGDLSAMPVAAPGDKRRIDALITAHKKNHLQRMYFNLTHTCQWAQQVSPHEGHKLYLDYVQLLKTMHDDVMARIAAGHNSKAVITGLITIQGSAGKNPLSPVLQKGLTTCAGEMDQETAAYLKEPSRLKMLTSLGRHPYARQQVSRALRDRQHQLEPYLDTTRARALFCNDFMAVEELYSSAKTPLGKLFYGKMYLWLTADPSALDQQYPGQLMNANEAVAKQRGAIQTEISTIQLNGISKLFQSLKPPRGPVFNAIKEFFGQVQQAFIFGKEFVRGKWVHEHDAAFAEVVKFLNKEARAIFRGATKPWVPEDFSKYFHDSDSPYWPGLPPAVGQLEMKEEKDAHSHSHVAASSVTPGEQASTPLETDGEPVGIARAGVSPAEVSVSVASSGPVSVINDNRNADGAFAQAVNLSLQSSSQASALVSSSAALVSSTSAAVAGMTSASVTGVAMGPGSLVREGEAKEYVDQDQFLREQEEGNGEVARQELQPAMAAQEAAEPGADGDFCLEKEDEGDQLVHKAVHPDEEPGSPDMQRREVLPRSVAPVPAAQPGAPALKSATLSQPDQHSASALLALREQRIYASDLRPAASVLVPGEQNQEQQRTVVLPPQ